MATMTREVLVTNATGGTCLDPAPLLGRRHVRVVNLGPNAIHIVTLARKVPEEADIKPVVGTAIPLSADATLEFDDFGSDSALWAIAATAAQAAGNGTLVVEW